MEGISNPQEPLLLAEKFPFFICSGNTDWAPRCARPVQGAKLDDEQKDLCAACRALAQMLGSHGHARGGLPGSRLAHLRVNSRERAPVTSFILRCWELTVSPLAEVLEL